MVIIQIINPAMLILIVNGVVKIKSVKMLVEERNLLPIAVIMMMMRQPAKLMTADGTRKS